MVLCRPQGLLRGADPRRRSEMRARFDRIFRRRTGFATLDRLLARLHANKAELLTVLDRPEIPLHTNGSERDIRCHVIKRKISGGTHSDNGRDCRDAFLGLMHTCTKLGIAFWDYLGARLGIQPYTCPLPAKPHPLPRITRLKFPARNFAPATIFPPLNTCCGTALQAIAIAQGLSLRKAEPTINDVRV